MFQNPVLKNINLLGMFQIVGLNNEETGKI